MAEPPAAVGIALTRVFAAPRERVWREWVEPARFADWFGGVDAEVPLATIAMDVRPGGSWRATMFAGPERREIHWRGEYREVEAPERLVFTLTDQPDSDAYELIVVVLTDLGDGRTEMSFQQLGHMTPEEYERAGSGWSTFFDRIEARLAMAVRVSVARSGISPELAVRRGREAVEFYERAFGAVEIYRVGGTEEHPPVVSQLAVGDSTFWVADESPPHGSFSPESLGGSTVRLLLVVEDPGAVVERAVSLGASEQAPVGEEHGWLLGRIQDPFGHQWEIGRPLGEWPPAPAGAAA
jgi:PhnB protein